MKGSILDIVGVVTIVMFFAISALIGWTVTDQIQDSASFTSIGGNTTYLEQAKSSMEVWDWGILFIIFGSMFFVLITAYQVDTHPALFIFGVLVFIICIILVVIMSNTFYEIHETTQFADAAAEYTNLIYVMDHFVEIMIVFGFLLVVVVYGKLKGIGGNI